jgi:hypothetical protein
MNVLLATINATERTDLRATENDLRQQCGLAGLNAFETSKLIDRTSEVLAQLLEHGNELVSIGDQLRVVRKIRVDRHLVKLVFWTTGSKPSLLERLFTYLFG